MSVHRFAHHRLDAFHVAKAALVLGHQIANALPRGYASLADQLRRAVQGAYLQVGEGAARDGADRKQRMRISRAEAGEATDDLARWWTSFEAADAAERESMLKPDEAPRKRKRSRGRGRKRREADAVEGNAEGAGPAGEAPD